MKSPHNYKLSVVIPTANENENSFFIRTLESLARFDEVEVICIPKEEAQSRAERLNLGFRKASATMILFHHPRSFVDPKGIQYLVDHYDQKIWGGFTHEFDYQAALLRFTSWYSNKIRGGFFSILYLDHCIFFHRDLWQNPIPAVEIFEDTLLSKSLSHFSKPVILKFKSTTSAVRFIKNGIWTQALINQIMKICFYLGLPHDMMNRVYERGLNLNSKK